MLIKSIVTHLSPFKLQTNPWTGKEADGFLRRGLEVIHPKRYLSMVSPGGNGFGVVYVVFA